MTTATKIRLWTVEEYHKMIESGILTRDSHVELLEGRIVEMSFQGPLHAATTQRASDYIKARLHEQAHVRMQLPVTLPTSEPEPDVAVVRIDRGAYGDHHPTPDEIFLLVEVADTIDRQDACPTGIDRLEKAPLYARANIPEYWILDVSDRQAYIFRDRTSVGYRSSFVLPDNAAIALRAFPTIEISLSELFLP